MTVGLTFDAVPTATVLRSVYMAAFTPPPWHETPDQIDAFADRPTFRVSVPAGSPYGLHTWPSALTGAGLRVPTLLRRSWPDAVTPPPSPAGHVLSVECAGQTGRNYPPS